VSGEVQTTRTALQHGPHGLDNGGPFTTRQLTRLDEALTLSSRESGLRFSIYVGELQSPTRAHAEALFEKLTSDAVLIAVSEGLGTAILAGGQIQSGFNGLAGEFGHISMDRRGPLCGCGMRGCWEMYASSRAALKAYRRFSGRSHVRNMQDLLRLVQDRDPSALKAIRSQASALRQGLRLVTAALSPERILITGEITSCWDVVGPVVQSELEKGMLAGSAPQLTIAGDGFLARLSGGAALVMQRHSHYHRSTHVARSQRPSARS